MNIQDVLLSSISPTIFILLLGSFVKSAMDLRRDHNQRGISIIPYLTLLSNCSVWTLYAIMSHDVPVLVANFVGVCVAVGCSFTYHTYSTLQAATWNYMVAAGIIAIGLFLAANHQVKEAGNMAMILSICIYGAPLVTLSKVIEEKSTQSMPFLISLGNFLSSISWTLYGLIVAHDVRIVVPSVIGAVLATVQMLMFIIYGFGPPRTHQK